MKIVIVLLSTLVAGSAIAGAPLKLTIQTEGIALPDGTICRADVSAEYRIVQPRVSRADAGRHKAVTDDMATFRAAAAERRTWRFVASKASNGRESFDFTLPANLPRAHAGAHAVIYVPVTYSIVVPGFPEVKSDSTFVIPIENPSTPVSRCLRFELINNGESLRAGLLPSCADSFDKRAATVLTGD